MIQWPHHSEEERPMQLPPRLGDLWETEIVPQLPADLDEQACLLKALQRTREIDRASDLLRALLAWVLGRCSFRQLGAWAVILGVADISEGAWRKRVRLCGDWLQWLLSELVSRAESKEKEQGHRRVILVDGTSLGETGGTGDDWRVQLAYDLVAGRLVQVQIGDRRFAETLVGLPGQPGDVFLGDRNYGKRDNLVAMDALQATTLTRFSPQHCRLEHADGTTFAVIPWLQAQRNDVEICETERYAVHDAKRVQVRVLALRLPEDAAEQARQRVLARAKRKGQAVRPETLFLAGWVLLVSTLPASDWSAQELFWLYRHRWQVELLIKQMKQFLLLVQLRSHHPETVRAALLAALVAWALQEEEGQALLRQLFNEPISGEESLVHAYLPLLEQWEAEEIVEEPQLAPRPTVSVWGILACCLTRWRGVVLGQWSLARVQWCLPRLKRFFCPSPRRRLHHRLAFQAWVQQRLLGTHLRGGFL
jgi:Transposase DDE domain